ncbi:MAG: DNA-3-methyladenine glycosylase I [Flavobacteriales bacterium]|nr:DNA-3-methyladenine glycosylase I [Flavobacteriales bacterium]MBK6944680.1 DNA-3-methyladenine glycosylase I [Flavobacteriales bacterium]MBK7241172.1 DNA-3-methyladenine glycosylase I [Flavobacteriales bacterium]MBK7295678.1 DNA-3-methyladenine glycosylase I [Flavobacteriales bacterium]MBK9534335.1 DNA-3-methyladenine glycosylase I [Flavobacteriales bacterium]
MERERCPWCLKDDIYKDYHDRIWGRPEHDDAKLFEKLCLDGAQAGLSWYTILIRTESYRKAFDGWDAEKIACYDEKKIMQLMKDPGIIRNRLKIQGVVKNANAYLRIKEQGSFSDHLWNYVDHTPQVNQWTSISQVPATSSISDALSKDLKKAGFSFVGSTIVYAFMQAVGMVDDHLVTCWRRNERK